MEFFLSLQKKISEAPIWQFKVGEIRNSKKVKNPFIYRIFLSVKNKKLLIFVNLCLYIYNTVRNIVFWHTFKSCILL